MKVAVDVLPEPDKATGGVVIADPFWRQLVAIESPFASERFALSASEPPTAKTLPVAAGVCEHEGGEFRITLHVWVVVPEELTTSARKLFDPGSNDPDVMV